MRFHHFNNIITEVNHNNPELVKKALTAPIQCGFEVEVVWPEEEELPFDIEGIVDHVMEYPNVVNDYERYLVDSKEFSDIKDELENEVIDEIVAMDHKESEAAFTAFMNDYDPEAEIPDDLSDLADRYRSEFSDWVVSNGRNMGYIDEGALFDAALDEVRNRLTPEDWLEYEYGSVRAVFDAYPEASIDIDATKALAHVHEYIQHWARHNSKVSTKVTSGDYHHTSDPTVWRVESDSSIKGPSGTVAAEIISPVYERPSDMLRELRNLLEFIKGEFASTNRSTGLHITMSWNGGDDRTPTDRLKMAVLLDDPYILQQYGRSNNAYTASMRGHIENLLTTAHKRDLLVGMSVDAIRDRLADQIQNIDRRTAMNVKNADNDRGNNHIEFRAAGGDYLNKPFSTITNTVVRYATAMMAGHDPEFLKREFHTKFARMLNKVTDAPYFQPGTPPIQQIIRTMGVVLPMGASIDMSGKVTSTIDPLLTVFHVILKELARKYQIGYNGKIPSKEVKAIRDWLTVNKVNNGAIMATMPARELAVLAPVFDAPRSTNQG